MTRDTFSARSARENLIARVYRLPDRTQGLPDFDALQPVGALYVRKLDISGQAWPAHLATVSDTATAFGIDYRGSFTSGRAAAYRFTLISDGPARLLIDDHAIIESDGADAHRIESDAVPMMAGRHSIEAQYAHRPGQRQALQLLCQGPDGREAVFPGCGLALRGSPLWRLWLWWVAVLASLGAVVIWQTRRRIARESRGLR